MTNFLLSCALSICVTTAATHRAFAYEQVLIVETWSCADWASRTKGAAGIERHLVGLINGMAMGAGLDLWGTPTEVKSDQVFYWMDQYCAANPLDDLVQGAANFALERRGTAWVDRFSE